MQKKRKRHKMSGFNIDKIKQNVIHHLKHVYDPEIPVNIYDLGLIYDITLEEENNGLTCYITMTLTSPGCPVADSLVTEVQQVATAVNEVDETSVRLTFEPTWNFEKVTKEGKEMLTISGVTIPKY